ncbi:hypothetical protein QQ045_003482 [Rhodiola kirilowii]
MQTEMLAAAYTCAIQTMDDSEDGNLYIINDAKRTKLFQVKFIEIDDNLNCSCKNLDSCGIICWHLFKVMFFLKYERILDFMVKPRWHKEASQRYNPGLFVVHAESS